jgi:uncharacterized protein (TIGR03437 family)
MRGSIGVGAICGLGRGGNRLVRAILRALSICILAAPLARPQVNILTANGGNDRSNSNLRETQLSPSTVSSTSFGKVTTLAVDGQVYAQPLYASGVSVAGVIHNILFVATQHNSVYAFDADAVNRRVLWQVNLGPSVPATMLFGKYGDIASEVGILSTPVIDLQRGVIYVVSDKLVNGTPVFQLHALDVTTGAEQFGGPVVISASIAGSGSGGSNGGVPFDPAQHIQRPGLLLANGMVHIAFGSHGDISPYHGWLLGYDASDLTRPPTVHMTTPNGDGGSYWQSGRGLAADPSGNIYGITGNGDYDGRANWGQSFLKLSASLSVSGAFTPADWKSESDNDADISAGPALISNSHTVVGADKSGNLYLLDAASMGQAGPDGNAFQVFQISSGSIFNFAVWNRGDAALIYLQGRGEALKCYQYTPAGFNSNPLSQTTTSTPYARIGLTLSANGSQDGTGILWEITGNYNDVSTNATLHAFDANNLASELWNSDMNGSRDSMGPITKFVGPTIANGRVFAPSLDNSVIVYGLLSQGVGQPPAPVVNAVASTASYAYDAISPGEAVAVFGAYLSSNDYNFLQVGGDGMVTTSLGETQVLFNGIPAPMIFTGPNQVNAVVPFGIKDSSVQVQVQYQDRVSDPFTIAVAPATPGIFSIDGSGAGQAAALNQDGSVNSADTPAAAGSVISLFATGAGQFDPPMLDGAVVSPDNLPSPVLPVSVQIGGRNAAVVYAGGAPGAVAGVLQVNVRVPFGTGSGPAVPITLRVGTAGSQTGITIAVQ